MYISNHPYYFCCVIVLEMKQILGYQLEKLEKLMIKIAVLIRLSEDPLPFILA